MKSEEAAGLIRIESVSEEKPPSCCLCLNVRIGAIFIGLLYLVVYSAWLVVNTPKIIQAHNQEKKGWEYYDFHAIAERHNVDKSIVTMILACLIFLLVIMMIYGAALRRSNFIIPFFCWQVFDLCRLVFSAATMISYADRVKFHFEYLEDDYGYLKDMSLQKFRLVLITTSLIIISVVYYMMNVIWDAYKHAKCIEERHAGVEAVPSYMVYQGDMESMTRLPTYDDVVKTSPPPAYSQ